MRFVAPARSAATAARIAQPIFDGLAEFRPLLVAPAWPGVSALDAAVQPLWHRVTGRALRLVAQDTLDDGENYERRILQHGLIATRPDNWHDLLNALVWQRFPAIKSALNVAQVEDMAQVGLQQRTRRQAALTQFDEAGAVLVLRDRQLLGLWDRHDWQGLFLQQRAAWMDGRISLAVFGHALFEHALNPDMLLVSKTLVLLAEDDRGGRADALGGRVPAATIAGIDQRIAAAIAAGACLGDPLELRPLPLSGIPGWHPEPQDAAFYRDKPCFRPLRPGREYPAPLRGTSEPPPPLSAFAAPAR